MFKKLKHDFDLLEKKLEWAYAPSQKTNKKFDIFVSIFCLKKFNSLDSNKYSNQFRLEEMKKSENKFGVSFPATMHRETGALEGT